MFTTSAALVTTIRSTATKAGVAWPDELEAELTAARATQTATTDDAPTQADLADLAAAAALAGRDPATDPELTAALHRYQLAQAVPSGVLKEAADRQVLEALNRHAGTLVEGLQAVVAEADKALHQARQAIPGIDVYDPAQAGGLRPDQAGPWAKARDAAQTVEIAAKSWRMLAHACRWTVPADNTLALLLAPLDARQVDDLRTAKQRVRDVVKAGHRLNLADPEEFQRRIEQVSEQRAQLEQRREAAFRDNYQQTHGMVRVR